MITTWNANAFYIINHEKLITHVENSIHPILEIDGNDKKFGLYIDGFYNLLSKSLFFFDHLEFFSSMKYYQCTSHKVLQLNILKVVAQTISSSRLLISHRHSKPFQVLHQRSLNETFADKGNLFPLLTEP